MVIFLRICIKIMVFTVGTELKQNLSMFDLKDEFKLKALLFYILNFTQSFSALFMEKRF